MITLTLPYPISANHSSPCIETSACKNSAGYGHVRFGGRVVRAHRLAYAQAHGLSLSDIAGVVIRHACDNPACVNPDHLLPGSHTDNMRDMRDRGRNRQPKGERNAKAKLTEANVSEIRRRIAGGETNQAIAKDYGVSPSQISRINTRKIWGHIA